MNDIFDGLEEHITQEMLDMEAKQRAEREAEQNRLHEAEAAIDDLGYKYIQEAISDSIQLGVVNKESKTWESVSDITSVRSDRIVISKAQAKKQGLEIVVSE